MTQAYTTIRSLTGIKATTDSTGHFEVVLYQKRSGLWAVFVRDTGDRNVMHYRRSLTKEEAVQVAALYTAAYPGAKFVA